MAHMVKSSLALALLVAFLAVRGYAGELKIGDAAPDFRGLIGVDEAKHALADYQNAKLIALVFTCNHCPVARAYEDRLIALQKAYGAKGVQLVAVNVSKVPADGLNEMKQRDKEQGFNFPYLFDATQKIGRDYGATVTPHVFVLDGRRKIAYIGAVDDNMLADKMKTPYLLNALDALLAGKAVAMPTTKAFGCGIKYQ
jgi:peroxiredoxin